MKRFLSLFSIILILLFTSWILWKNFSEEKGPVKSSVISYIPSNSALIVKCNSLERLYELIERKENSIWGKRISASERLGTFSTEEIGRYLLPLDSLRAQGIDIHREVGFSLHEVKTGFEQASSSALLFIPIIDEESFLLLFNLKNSMKLERVNDKTRPYRYYQFINVQGAFERYATFKGGYLWVVIGATEGACALSLDRLHDGASVSETSQYQKLEQQLSTNQDVMIYTNYAESKETRGLFLGFLQTIVHNFENSIAAPLGAQLLNIDKEAALYSFKIDGSTLHGETSYLHDSIQESSPILPLTEQSEHLSGTPLLLTSFSSDITALVSKLDTMLETGPSTNDSSRSSLFKEIAPLFGNRVYLALHDADSITFQRPHAVLSLELSNPQKADSLFTHYLDLEEENPLAAFTKVILDDRPLFRLTLMEYYLYATIEKNRLFITTEADYIPQLCASTTSPPPTKYSDLGPLTTEKSDSYIILELQDMHEVLQRFRKNQGIELTMPGKLKRLILSQSSNKSRVITRFSLSSSYEKAYLRSIVTGLGSVPPSEQ